MSMHLYYLVERCCSYSKGYHEYGQRNWYLDNENRAKAGPGPVMLQSKIKIHPNFNYEELSKEMSKRGAKLILEALELIEVNKAEFKS